jgi:hypothetical protein
MRYLVLEDDRAKICTEKTLRAWIEHTHGRIRVFRLCGLNQPIELFLRWFGNCYLIRDRFGNNEGV